jgi:hypothetical protein
MNLDKLLSHLSPHQRDTCFTKDFLWAQWEAQHAFHTNLNEEEIAHKEELAQFFEQGETIKTLVYVIICFFLVTCVQANFFPSECPAKCFFQD